MPLVVGLPMMAADLPTWVAWLALGLLVGGAGAFDAHRSDGLGTHPWYGIAPGAELPLLRLGVDLGT